MFSKMMTLLTVPVATLAGNLLGASLRSQLTGRPAFGLTSEVVTAGGTEYKNFPVATKFYPALLAAILGKPRWLLAFLAGVLTGVAVDDRFEAMLFDQIGGWLVPLQGATTSRDSDAEKPRQ